MGSLLLDLNVLLVSLSLNQVGRSLSWLVHRDMSFRMHINSQTDLVSIEVIDGIEVSEESIADQEEILILTWQSAFMDDKVAFSLVAFVKVLLWVDLEDVIAHLEAHWFDLGGNLLTWLLDVAEGLIGFAIEIWESRSPLGPNLLEDVWRDRQL